MDGPAKDDADASDATDDPAIGWPTVAIAVVGAVAIAIGVGGVLATDASLTDFDSVYPFFLIVGLGCYVYLKFDGSA